MCVHIWTSHLPLFNPCQVFYWVGYNGIGYVLDIFIADTSSLKNRAWLFAFTTCPYIANTFAGPAAAQGFLRPLDASRGFLPPLNKWRWAFGAFSIITPVVSTPVVVIFLRSRRKAEDLGYLSKEKSGRTLQQSILHYLIEFDGAYQTALQKGLQFI
jgi:hypothetical protein